MSHLVFAVWRANAERMPNTPVANRLDLLNTQVSLVKATTSPAFIVFVAAEFLFMHANRGQDDVRWYSPAERDEALAGLASSSRRFGRLLLAGGSICWARTSKPTRGKCQWEVLNEAPVHYNGQQLVLHNKRLAGGEVLGDDAIRLYLQRRGAIDLTQYIVDTTAPVGVKRYVTTQRTGSPSAYSDAANSTVRMGPGGTPVPAAPGIKQAHDRYVNRITHVKGTGEGSFDVPGSAFTGGIEVCQEHNGTGGQGTLQATSSRGAVNFHLLTSNSVSYVRGHEHLADPGFFLHCDTQGDPMLLCRSGGATTAVPATQWQEIHPELSVTSLPMPAGL